MGRTLRIRFRIEEHAELTAVGCDPALSAAIQDCEVAFVPAGASGSLSVTDPVEETLAGKVQSPPMAEGVYLTLRLLQNDAFPAADIPEGNQLPYFVDVTAVDAAGSPVTFVGAGASLTLCQVE